MPTKGMRFSANATRPEPPASQVPGSNGSAGTALRKTQKMMTNRIEKTIPATAAALGVLRCEYMGVSS